MPVIGWKNSYNLGIDVIDKQHHHLVDLLNKLFNSLNEDREGEALHEVLNELADYTKAHFNTEETFFEEFNYEGAKDHIMEHRKFEEKAAQFKKEFKEKGSVILYDVIKFIGEWFLDHEESYDRKYVKCFKENGL